LITLLKPGLLATEADFRKKYVTRQAEIAQESRSVAHDAWRRDDRNTRAAADVQLPHRIAAR